jgi:diguanylate cyclase (GGDEF)-like protein
MTNRVEMLEAALDLVDGGVAILDDQGNVVFWNKSAANLTGYLAQDLTCRPCPEGLYHIGEKHHGRMGSPAEAGIQSARNSADDLHAVALIEDTPEREDEIDNSAQSSTFVSMIHRLGHSVPVMLRKAMLRNCFGKSTGAVLLFYPVEEVDTLPHGDLGEGADIERSQADMEDRLDAAHHQWITARMPFGLLWITVDQAQSLRRTHGRDACEAMLRTVEQTLLRQMKPAEIIGRWGNNEFLVLAHERTSALLAEHGQRLAGLARTADFRWWGDRVGLTVSIGASHAIDGDTLQSLLNRARQAMQCSAYAGGNQVTEAREG